MIGYCRMELSNREACVMFKVYLWWFSTCCCFVAPDKLWAEDIYHIYLSIGLSGWSADLGMQCVSESYTALYETLITDWHYCLIKGFIWSSKSIKNKCFVQFWTPKIQQKWSDVPTRAFLMLTVSEGMLNIVCAAATHIILTETQDTFKYTFIKVLNIWMWGCKVIFDWTSDRWRQFPSLLSSCCSLLSLCHLMVSPSALQPAHCYSSTFQSLSEWPWKRRAIYLPMSWSVCVGQEWVWCLCHHQLQAGQPSVLRSLCSTSLYPPLSQDRAEWWTPSVWSLSGLFLWDTAWH